jgi:Na+-translocating ferredoxin:NAD+ oxidoreductase subunit D
MTTKKESLLTLSSAPHVKSQESVSSIMWLVVAALTPAAAYSVYIFGINSLILLVSAILGAVAAEVAYEYAMKKRLTGTDGSAVITGLLVAMNVPPGAPVWMVVIGSFFAIIIVKQLFGGLGFNIFNPALAARAFMIASWPVHMTTGWFNFDKSNVFIRDVKNSMGFAPELFDAITQATPLTALKEGPKIFEEMKIGVDQLYSFVFSADKIKPLFFGSIGGVVGETSAILLLLGGAFLLWKRVITWHIPVAYMGTVAGLAFIYYLISGVPNVHIAVLFHLLSGGLILGAFFMATDMVTSPVTNKGMIIFGAGCGLITFIIRIWGGYPEGVSYSILLMNAVTPLIDRYIKPRIFGT